MIPSQSQSQIHSYSTTGGSPRISSSWRQARRPTTRIFIFKLNTCGYSPLLREDGSVVYNCCWSSPAHSFSGPHTTGLMTTFYCLRFATHATLRARSPYLCPPGTMSPVYIPRHWVPFSSPSATRRATVEVFDPLRTGCSYDS
jgi:hypothetical protein